MKIRIKIQKKNLLNALKRVIFPQKSRFWDVYPISRFWNTWAVDWRSLFLKLEAGIDLCFKVDPQSERILHSCEPFSHIPGFWYRYFCWALGIFFAAISCPILQTNKLVTGLAQPTSFRGDLIVGGLVALLFSCGLILFPKSLYFRKPTYPTYFYSICKEISLVDNAFTERVQST